MAAPTYKKISELAELAAHPAITDFFPFVDDSASATKRVTLANIDPLKFLELTDPDSDKIAFWDDSAGVMAWLGLGSNMSIVGTNLVADFTSDPITTGEIEDLAVTTAKIDNLAVTAAKLGSLAVETAKINNLAVTAAKLGSLAVETAKINNLAVTEGKIASGAVTVTKIGTGAVTSPKIGASQVTPAKTDFFEDGVIYTGRVSSTGTISGAHTGWTAAKNATGTYTVTHTLGTTNYKVVVSAVGRVSLLKAVSANSFEVYTTVANGTLSDAAFHFILIKD